MDKEFQQIAPDTETGKRYADLLVKLWRKRGKELFLLLHVEVQDYQTQWQALEANPNPFATVVMAHLKAQETKRNANDRKEWKLGLIGDYMNLVTVVGKC
ncbi:hypothetical protein [Kovacikia minuta]|uniref:hypothetical protein n=1 Tax=Kovacikia minuta TaxID=2931930 RepID=UPI0020C79DD8|nr:hypothetical protein [Kovacikia minuta]